MENDILKDKINKELSSQLKKKNGKTISESDRTKIVGSVKSSLIRNKPLISKEDVFIYAAVKDNIDYLLKK